MAPATPQRRQYTNADNMNARAMLLAATLNSWQSIFERTYTTGVAGMVINVPIQNVGLLKRFVVKINATFARAAAETHTLTPWGPANILSRVQLTDLANQVRINTPGWHLHSVATAKRGMAFGAAFTNDSPVDMGSNITVMSAPSSFTTGAQTLQMFYEIPVAYSDFDLRGGIYASVVNATMQLQLTVNPNFSVGSTADETLAVYQSSTAGDLAVISSITVAVYQNYLDQVPISNGVPLLPLLDLSTAYMLQDTSQGGLVVNSDNPIPYANWRSFLSTMVLYDNAGVSNPGTDINYFALRAANYTNIFKYDPFTRALLTRSFEPYGAYAINGSTGGGIHDDFPAGSYYFDHRQKPISTDQYGNFQLIVNPSAVTSSASVFYIGFEMLAIINQLTQAGSLSPGT